MVRPKPVVSVFVRHKATCSHLSRGEFYRGCHCAKWLRYSKGGKQHRVSAGTRTWGIAEDKAAELQGQLDAGEAGTVPAIPEIDQPTVEQAIETFITAKQGEGIRKATIRKLRYQLGCFQRFTEERSKLFPSEVTATDVIEYRASWNTWKSGVTRQKAQQNLRGFLRSCCRTSLPDLLDALKPVRLAKSDKDRLEPRPFTEKELKHLLAQVPKTFPEKAAKMRALIHCMVATGLAIRDTVQLERTSLRDGWLRIERQKTGRPVRQRLDNGLCRELLSVANGNSKYIFWDGVTEATSAVGAWQADLRRLMQDANLWIKGNLSHRFRDTAVDFWLGSGCSMTDVAAALGDTVRTVERHYADLASKRMEERLAKMPTRSWRDDV
jgi:integrase